MSKEIVLCDLDGIVADLLKEWLGRYNADHGLRVTKHDILEWDIHKCVPHGEKIYDYIHGPGIFNMIDPLPGAVESLKLINEKYDLVILSTPSRASITAHEKIDWCAKHLPFIPRRQILLGARKDIVMGDYLIDDSPENLTKTPAKKRICISYPYNVGVKVDLRAMDHDNPESAWSQICWYLGVSGIRK